MSTLTALASELYKILRTDDLPNQNYVVAITLHSAREKGISRDGIVTEVLAQAVKDQGDGAKILGNLLGAF